MGARNTLMSSTGESVIRAWRPQHMRLVTVNAGQYNGTVTQLSMPNTKLNILIKGCYPEATRPAAWCNNPRSERGVQMPKTYLLMLLFGTEVAFTDRTPCDSAWAQKLC